jgi:hypothetical protein
MAPVALGSPFVRPAQLKKVPQEALDGFGTRAIHVGSDPDPNTGAVIPAISLSTTYKQDSVGHHKVSLWSQGDLSFPFVCCLFLTHFSYCIRVLSIPGLVTPIELPSNVLSPH